MTSFEIDVRLIGNNYLLTLNSKVRMIEEIIKDLGLSYNRWFCDLTNRADKRKHRCKYWKEYTCIFVVDCSEDYYKFLKYLIDKRFSKVEMLNRKI